MAALNDLRAEHKESEFRDGLLSQMFGSTYTPKAQTLRTILGEKYLKDRVISSPREILPW